jgi:hypothetical protein
MSTTEPELRRGSGGYCPLGSFQQYGYAYRRGSNGYQVVVIGLDAWHDAARAAMDAPANTALNESEGPATSEIWRPEIHYSAQLAKVPEALRTAIIAMSGIVDIQTDDDFESDMLDELYGS